MNIAVDLRSLHTSEFSGVESYTVNVLEQLLTRDRENTYTLFYNGFKRKRFEYLHFINAKYKQTGYPNRLLNLSIKLTGRPYLESLIGPCDILFLPNWNLCSVRPETKVILTVHDLSPIIMPEMYNIKARMWHSFINIKKLVHRADAIIAVSQHTKDALTEILKVPESRVSVAKLGVDQESFSPYLDVDQLRAVRNNYGLPGDFMLFIGTIEPRKNLYNLIEAFDRLEDPSHLVIAGKWGWKYREILNRIEKSPKRRMIKIIGYIPEADKPYIMKLARAFVWPSLYEGFGLPVLEAMSVGTPVLTSQVTSLPEVVGESALLVNPYNADDIAKGMEMVLRNESLRERYAVRGIERSREFTWDKTAAKLADIIDQFKK
jgi:glycosyltransferase involved in cell wall biosynthesis